MPKIESGDDKEVIIFKLLFLLNSLCDIIQDVYKHVYV